MASTLSMPLKGEPLTELEIAQARESSRALSDFANTDPCVEVRLTRPNGEAVTACLPGRAVEMLGRVLDEMAKGNPTTLIPLHAELTTHEAAELLVVSRPHLIKLLEEGRLPYRMVGTHRRIRYVDLLVFLEHEKEARRKILIELAEESQRLGLYD